MVRPYQPAYRPKCIVRDTLPSGRKVQIDQTCNDTVIIHVGADDTWLATTVPVKNFPLIGKPLAQRIREAVIQLDRPKEPEAPDAVTQAIRTAVYSGDRSATGPCGGYGGRHFPPLILSKAPPTHDAAYLTWKEDHAKVPPPPPPTTDASVDADGNTHCVLHTLQTLNRWAEEASRAAPGPDVQAPPDRAPPRDPPE